MTRQILFSVLLICIGYGTMAQVIDDNGVSVFKGVYGTYSPDDTIPKVVPLINFANPFSSLETQSESAGRALPSSNLHPHIPNQVAIDKNKAVGEIPVIEGSTPTGGRTYNIPIQLVPGREAAQLQLGITYNHQAGNGILGKGWNISGLSVITRGNYSIYCDGKTSPAGNTLNDPFYLDGKRLIKISQNSSIVFYQSEQGNIKVEGIISSGNIKYFRVRYPNGGIAILGYPYQIINTQVYPIIEYSDVHHNVIDYNYHHTNNQFRINTINYGRNSQQGNSNYASVHFAYTQRDDVSFVWNMGVKTNSNYLLSSIVSKDNSNPVRTYRFSYSGQMQKLLSKVECNANGSELNPLAFYYGENNQLQAINKLTTNLGSWFSNTSVNNLAIKKGKFSAWSDDDGLIVYPPKTAYHEYYKSGNWNHHSKKYYQNLMHPDQEILVYHGLESSFHYPQKTKTGTGFIDMFSADVDKNNLGEEVVKINMTNDDNVYDRIEFSIYKSAPASSGGGLAFWKKKTFRTRTILSWHNSRSVHPKFFYPGDFNGDGINEIFAISCNHPLGKQEVSSRCYLFDLQSGTKKFDWHVFNFNIKFNTNGENNDRIIPFDYDADGKTDIGLINSSGLHIYTFKISGSSYSLVKVGSNSAITINNIKNKRFMFGEFNGDGKVDMLLSPQESYTTNAYYVIPVSTPKMCLSCNKLNPMLDNSYKCRHCNKSLFPSHSCYKCGRILEDGGGGMDLKKLKDENARFPGLGGLSCLSHGSHVNVTVPNYVDKGKNWTIYYSKGNGYFESKVVSVKNNDRHDEYVLQDMNGDGTTDLVCTNKSGNISVYPSRKGVLSTEKLNGSANVGSNAYLVPSMVAMGNYHSQVLALNNNKVYKLRYSLNEAGQQLLTAVVNSYGLVSKTRYQLMNSGDYDLYSETYGATFPYQKFCAPIYLTAETQTWLNNVKRTHHTFRYHNSILHRQGLGFRGFERISSYDRIRNQSVSSYFNPLQFGVLTKQESTQATVTNQYSINVASNKIVKINLSKKTVTDKVKGNTIVTTYSYDSYGNMLEEDVNYDDGSYDYLDVTYSNTNNSSQYVLGLPLSKKTTRVVNGNVFIEKLLTSYSNYRPKTITAYANNNKASETTYEYDALGNVIAKKEKAYSSSKTFTTRYKYDSNFRYQTETTDHLNHKTTFTRNALGQVTAETNFKGKKTTYAYDNLGRVLQSILPDGETNNYSYNWSNLGGDFLYKVTNTSNVSPASIEYLDAFGRNLRKGSIGFNGQWVYADTEFDVKGRMYRQSNPYFSGGTKLWTTYAYDSNDRVTSVTAPSGSVTSVSYSGNSITTSRAGRSSTKTSNVRGDVISASDPGGTIAYSIRGDGQPASITAPGGVLTRFEYDGFGRKTKMIDPSAGTVQYQYDTDGNLSKTIDGNNKTISKTYDQYNRLKQKVCPEFTTTYTYNSDGLLSSLNSSNGCTTSYTYNSLFQLTSKTEQIDGHSYSETYNYANGRLSSTTYGPLNYTLTYHYNSNNYLYSLRNNGAALWTVNTQDAHGKLTKQTFGNGVVANNNYDTYGMPTEVKAVKGSRTIQHFGYSFNNATGNLSSRSDQKRNITESFEYDNLDRLTKCSALGAHASVSYLPNGNISSTSELGAYTYENAAKPYAVSKVGNNNNLIPTVQQNINYTSFKRPAQISEQGVNLNYKYNHAFYRAKASWSGNGSTSTKYSFAQGKYDKEIKGGITTERLYIGGSPYDAPVVIEKKGSTLTTLYIHRDYLGSITQLTNQSGNLEAEYSYTAWGLLRNPANWQVYTQGNEPALRLQRGYTGHEHLFAFCLINMNGRMYDPLLKRFLSPDNYIQNPDFTQNFNRFGYCLNNPLKYKDENGEFFLGTIITFFVDLVKTAFFDGGLDFTSSSARREAWRNFDPTASWSATNKAWKIDVGGFITDPNRSFFGRLLQVYSRWTWELPQTLLGKTYTHVRNLSGKV
ncbi:MAG: hypothetical protein N4A59_09125, partial [Marinifilum sp.]|nr:hypothetical protein [Marinifilum sp.]